MKELTIEQKAKAYDEAIKRVENIRTGKCETTFMFTEGLLEHIFPELKESEDEQIRNGIIQYLEQSQFGEEHYQIDDDIVRNYIAWLEKQGEHAKFRDSIQVGDKVTRNQDGMLVNLSQLNRVAKKDEKQGEQKSIKVPKFKAGDFIQFNGMGHTRYTIKEVCGLSHYINTCDKRMDMSYTDANFELVEQKSAEWSDNDEWCLEQINFLIRNSYSVDDKVERLSNWVKSIKDRLLPQLKQEWSEEDEIMHKTIILNLKVQMENCAVPSKDSLNKAIGWFQKLKHQKTFVPSEEEMKALEFCLEHNIDKDGVFGSKVVNLYKKLKKLTK